ncbi:hypothetical protein [Streptomyces sp. CB01881]|uniref:hypothetical protein n=1 Tax=Streptomyces sp. CB01881 TaxID=2078691 RepID=UPI000CDCD0E7|nr:hypothetical protein [Streptomyces sp. CB01881]AUY52314.1 hypothetical protein C2142_29135 [Streptomyces sp. CB01881]TYC71736.1 hypothetical protein EH183_29110 [Streptomyces sp. CB01881]
MNDNRAPIAPDDPRMRAYTEVQVMALLAELHERGKKSGIVWPSATTDSIVDGRVLIRFGNAPVSTLLNLLNRLLDHEKAAEQCPS